MNDKHKSQVSDKAVLDATGKNRKEWFALIDNRNGTALTHKEIASMLGAETDLEGWWQQMITVEYELARGMREPHQMLDGYQISKSKTIAVDAADVYKSFIDETIRHKWLQDGDFKIRNSAANKSIRITWVDGKSHVDVYFYPKKDKTQVTINHKKLGSSEDAQKMKLYWGKQLENLSKFFAK